MGLNIKRRGALKKILKAIVGFLSLLFLVRFFSFKQKNSNTIILKKREIPANSAVVYPDKKIAVVNKENKLFALSLSCTHLGCIVKVTSQNIVCPCHGSIFTHDGLVKRGPAKKNLKKYKVIEDGDYFVIQG